MRERLQVKLTEGDVAQAAARLCAYDTRGIRRTKGSQREYSEKRSSANEFLRIYDWRYPEHFSVEVALLEKALKGLKNKRVLHVAGGHGILAGALNELYGAKAVNLDLSRVNASIGGAKTAPQIVADAERLPVKSGSLDAAVSDHFLASHYALITAKQQAILDELRRALKPGGLLVVSDYRESGLKNLDLRGWKPYRIRHPCIENAQYLLLVKDLESGRAGRTWFTRRRREES